MGNTITRQAYEKQAPSTHQASVKEQNTVIDINMRDDKNDLRASKDNVYLLRRMFCKLDPAVIKNSADTTYGQLKLSIKYASDHELLLVKVFEARYLTATSVRGHSFNPYVKIELVDTCFSPAKEVNGVLLLPENAPKYTSEVAHNDKLMFSEIFSFKLHRDNFNDVKLRCSVWSSDGLENDDFFGEIYLDVSQLDCIDVVQTAWHDLQSQTDFTIGGDLFIGLSYNLPQTLRVTVSKAVGIRKVDNNVGLSVRVFIPGVPYVFRTSPERGSGEHVWHETFSFPVPKEELVSRYLVLVVTDENEDDSYFGECHIDLENLDVAHGFEGSFQLADLRGNNVVRSRWNRNAVTQELQEALHAHSIYMRPEFLFDRNAPKTKALTVSVPRAYVHSQMRVVNGVVVQ